MISRLTHRYDAEARRPLIHHLPDWLSPQRERIDFRIEL
jgi:hypothetical protein